MNKQGLITHVRTMLDAIGDFGKHRIGVGFNRMPILGKITYEDWCPRGIWLEGDAANYTNENLNKFRVDELKAIYRAIKKFNSIELKENN